MSRTIIPNDECADTCPGVTLSELSRKLDSLASITLMGAKSVLDLDETALFTGLSKGHLYRLTSGRQIPFFRKNRKLYFRKSELEQWMCATPVKTESEIQSEASAYVMAKRRQKTKSNARSY